MKTILVAMVVAMATMGLTAPGGIEHESGTNVVLPNSELIGCRSSACSHLWQDKPANANAIYPRQVIVDIFGNGSCPRGIVALYDKSVSIDDLKAAVDERYGKWGWADNSTLPVKLWRVEPQKFAIQLAVTDERTERITPNEALAQAVGQALGHGDRSNVGEAGMKQIIYLAFAEAKCSPQ